MLSPTSIFRTGQFIASLVLFLRKNLADLNEGFDVTGCDTLTLTGLTLDNSDGDEPNSASGTKAAAHNSDGFDFSSSDNVLLSNTAVYNQDDCVAVTSGTNVTVTGMYCSGGHGLR